jgi:hypothetical protein
MSQRAAQHACHMSHLVPIFWNQLEKAETTVLKEEITEGHNSNRERLLHSIWKGQKLNILNAVQDNSQYST